MLATGVHSHLETHCLTQGEIEIAQVEGEIQDLLTTYKTIQNLDQKWSKGVLDSTFNEDHNFAKSVQKYYRDWMEKASSLLIRVQLLEKKGCKVGGSEIFRDTVGFCPADLDVDAIAATFKRLERGEGITLSKASRPHVQTRRAAQVQSR